MTESHQQDLQNSEKPPTPNTKEQIAADIKVLWKFLDLYCRHKHQDSACKKLNLRGIVAEHVGTEEPELCDACAKTFLHGASKRAQCPCDPKPQCKTCPTPCYQPGYREHMQDVMRYSGRLLGSKKP
jgi:hypothetical protein